MSLNNRIILLFFIIINVLTFTTGARFSLSWGNCGPNTDPIQLKSLVITPDPIRVTGNLTITGSADVGIQIPTDVHASVALERKVGPFFVKVPCVDNFGSCNYDNVCALWAQFCPKKYAEKYGLPCQCPIPASTYSISDANIIINKKLPAELLGEYRATVDFGSSSSHLGCVNIDLTVKN